MALHNLHGSKQSGLLSRVEHECSNEDNVPIMDKFQTRRHSLHGNNIFVCKTGLPEHGYPRTLPGHAGQFGEP